MKSRLVCSVLVAATVLTRLLIVPAMAAPLPQSPSAPTLFRMTGNLLTPAGEPRTGSVVLLASVYGDATDPTSLWTEQQLIDLGPGGRYTINVGSTLAGGVPKELFLNGSALWLGISVQGEVEQPRVMLVGVPYAVKAVDADLLGGRPPSDFALAENLNYWVQAALKPKAAVNSVFEQALTQTAFSDVLTVTGFGTHGFSAGGSGGNILSVRNTTAGTRNYAEFQLGNDVDPQSLYVRAYASDFSASGAAFANGVTITADQPGGLTLQAASAAAPIRFFSGGFTKQAELTSGGLFNVYGFGTHTFSAGSSGGNILGVRNTASGAGNYAEFQLGNDVDAQNLYLRSYSSTFASSGAAFANGVTLTADQAGGLTLQSASASAPIRFFSGGFAERARFDAAGNLGIGTTSPTAKLDVNGNINVSGNINAKYQDVAEWVEATLPLEDGTVVIVDPAAMDRVVAASRAYDTRVAGAVSRQPGLVLGERGDNKVMVAANGRVRIKVDASYGAIKIGDLLVTSNTPGHAMRSRPVTINGKTFHRAGTLLGKALEALPNGRGEILVLLMLQ